MNPVIPHLRFKAKPLDVYVASAGQRAEREQWAVIDAQGNLQGFKSAADLQSIEYAAEQALAKELASRTLSLTCSKCRKQAAFIGISGETPATIIKKARISGWFHEYYAKPPARALS